MYKTIWLDEAIEDLAKIDRVIAQKIFDKVEDYLAKNPYAGKPLVGQFKYLHGYHFSRYRVIYQIKNQELLITIVKVDHRREVYKSKNK